jgi:hypothetical protein
LPKSQGTRACDRQPTSCLYPLSDARTGTAQRNQIRETDRSVQKSDLDSNAIRWAA